MFRKPHAFRNIACVHTHTYTRIDVLCSWFAKHSRFIKYLLHPIDVNGWRGSAWRFPPPDTLPSKQLKTSELRNYACFATYALHARTLTTPVLTDATARDIFLPVLPALTITQYWAPSYFWPDLLPTCQNSISWGFCPGPIFLP